MNILEFEEILKHPECENLEFKSAKNSFNRDKDLPDYCATLANEGGGKLILGVDDSSRKVTGTNAFKETYNQLSNFLLNSIGVRVEVKELLHTDGRILIFNVPSRRKGQLIKSIGKYKYPMRAGESLTEMDITTIKKILNEEDNDFSAEIVKSLTIDDLDMAAIQKMRELWATKSARQDFLEFNDVETLRRLSLMKNDGSITHAALILLGKQEKIDEFLPDAEIVFEWRQDAKKTSYDFRKNWRDAILSILNQIWLEINSRNLRIPFQEGFIQHDIWSFNEKSIREAVLNAITHRDYRVKGQSIFISASPEKFFIKSPGGFIDGITPENILENFAWRNRLLAECLEKMGLVERSGQGLDDIFEISIRDGKGSPQIYSDGYSVSLTIPAGIKDKQFILFLEKIANDKQISFSFNELLELEEIRTMQITNELKFKEKFLKFGIIEKVGRGRGTKYILSHNYYVNAGKLGLQTKLIGTGRENKKQLIIAHLKRNRTGHLLDFIDAFPELKIKDIQNLLQELKQSNNIEHIGKRRSGYWKLKTNS